MEKNTFIPKNTMNTLNKEIIKPMQWASFLKEKVLIGIMFLFFLFYANKLKNEL
jgi:hypothetical protein